MKARINAGDTPPLWLYALKGIQGFAFVAGVKRSVDFRLAEYRSCLWRHTFTRVKNTILLGQPTAGFCHLLACFGVKTGFFGVIPHPQ